MAKDDELERTPDREFMQQETLWEYRRAVTLLTLTISTGLPITAPVGYNNGLSEKGCAGIEME